MSADSFTSLPDMKVPPSVCQSESSAACGTAPTNPALHTLTDQEREAAIRKAGELIEMHMAEWERSGCFAARGMADYAKNCMERLIRGRSPEAVARMERERGLL